MKTYSSENIKIKIKCFIDSALKKKMSWDILASVIDNMTPTLNKFNEVIIILLDIIHDKEEPGSVFQDKEQLLDRSIEVSEDSCIDFENKSQIEEVLLETPVDVSTDIQTVENLQDQFLYYLKMILSKTEIFQFIL